MAFAKLSGSLLESDARPARTPEQPPVPAVAARDILQPLARLAEAAPLYDSLWEFIRTGDEEGVARVVAELVRAGRSVSEISEVVESLSHLMAGPDSSIEAADPPQPGAMLEFVEGPPDLAPDRTHEAEAVRADDNLAALSWETDPGHASEPAVDVPPQAEYETAIWPEPAQNSAEPAIAVGTEPRPIGERLPELTTAFPSPNSVPRRSSGRIYLGAALAVLVAIAGGGALLLGQPAVKQVGATAALPVEASAKLAVHTAAPRADESIQAVADRPVARPAEPAKTTPVPPPEPAKPAAVARTAPAASEVPPIASPEAKKAETPRLGAQAAATPASISVPVAATPAASPVVSTGSEIDRPQPKPLAAENEPALKIASAVPAQAEQSALSVPSPGPTASPIPPDRLAPDRAERSPAVASLEPPKNSPAVLPPPAPAPPIGAPDSAALEPKDPPAMPIDTAPLLERGDRLFGTGDIASARLFYERAADAGNGQAALRLGETYDPAFLQRAQLRVAGDRGLAMFWYGRARELGADEADILLKGMQSR